MTGALQALAFAPPVLFLSMALLYNFGTPIC